MPDQPAPGDWAWDRPPTRPHRQDASERALDPADDFRRTVIFTIAGTAVPGLGLIAARRRIVGSVILGTLRGDGARPSASTRSSTARACSGSPSTRLCSAGSAVALIVIAIVWVGVVVASHLSLRGSASTAQRATGGVLVGVLAFAVAAPMAVAARYSYDQASSVNTVFKSEKQHQERHPADPGRQPDTQGGQTSKLDPWEDKPRLNVLLLGGDADRNRVGTRTDTVILASIDTKTGDTTLFSLPRNTARMPFPADSPLHKYYPNGFTNGDGNNAEYFLNAMYDNVPNTVPKDILGPTDNLGADALKLSVGEALGLRSTTTC